MTPAARVQASIEILDNILAGAPVEKALTGWARRSRFAGSKDRAAVRDHVFEALRCKRSFSALGGAETGRGLMIGSIRSTGGDPETLFTGERYTPEPLTAADAPRAFSSGAERFDIPEWLWPRFQTSLGDQAKAAAQVLQTRAPVHLRANLAKTDRAGAIAALSAYGICAKDHSACETALEVTEGARKIAQSRAYSEGVVELQDAASQAVVAALDLQPGLRVLDYCAGGGGKSLALAAHSGVEVFAHDVNAGRMRDLPMRTKRAGVRVTCLQPEDVARQAPFDIVLTDAPCSGSGSWRRAPAGKWALSEEGLHALNVLQSDILNSAAQLVGPGGILVYATCSMLDDENGNIVDGFLKLNPDWTETMRKSWLVTQGADGFFMSHLTR
ncbi:RsmB/NOP family class I SAM-dependent RNA methyltransferase [Ruegeria atlantica]|uniref:Ribosomal RNA small subunit methyltransferase B n=1 Tax=Ruegeria atlantica TaxID=81569 RepID=A0A0P1EF41_9RHOB|nr:RsmB/NOP family class I SAM-dependent RNA methyltransferase [Ruegeria atlantica]CUH48503.1 Ribosomal RNA small subunit methyltransferase B [Ruegeria atlantica]